MTPSEQARAMGDYIREHGFSPRYFDLSKGPHCGCFLHAFERLYADNDYDRFATMLWPAIQVTVGAAGFRSHQLMDAGYASDADRDKAVEACYAAARMLEGK